MFVTAAGICQYRSSLTDSSVHEASAVAVSKNRSVMKKKKITIQKSFHADAEFAELKQLHCGGVGEGITHSAQCGRTSAAASCIVLVLTCELLI